MKSVILGLMLWLPLAMSAATYRLEGMVGGKYPIVIELEETQKGLYSGRYAYNLTLKRDGDAACSWLYIKPDQESPYSEWIITDCKGKVEERWYNVNFIDHQHLTARMKNVKGKVYDIEASIAGQSDTKIPLNSYFKQHLGEYASDFNLLSDSRIAKRFEDFMGILNFDALKEIYQVQVPIEYAKGMFWSYGFMPHQCCDPVAIWAYDTQNNSFYVWIRKNDRDYWWSESGNVPFEFKELVDATF